jgi:hypothetical protein
MMKQYTSPRLQEVNRPSFLSSPLRDDNFTSGNLTSPLLFFSFFQGQNGQAIVVATCMYSHKGSLKQQTMFLYLAVKSQI